MGRAVGGLREERDGSADLAALGVGEAGERIRGGTLSPVALVEACLERIRALDGTLEAWVHVDEKGALAVARERARESERAAVRGPLHGIPFAVKDIFDVAGLPTTAGAGLRPAAYCGVVGFKPTHGLVSTTGVIPLAGSLDHVGVFTRGVADAGLVFSVLARQRVAVEPGNPPRLALAPELLRRASREVAAHVQATADAFARAGATLTEVKLPRSFDGIHAAGQTVLESEAAAFHEPLFAKYADQYGPEIRKLVERGLTISAVTYLGANRARLAFREEVMEVLAAHDALLSPTAPTPAPEGLAWTGDASLCAPWSFAGVPAISLPSGLTPSGLPLAIQLVQAAGASARLLSVAAWCERQVAFTRSPGL